MEWEQQHVTDSVGCWMNLRSAGTSWHLSWLPPTRMTMQRSRMTTRRWTSWRSTGKRLQKLQRRMKTATSEPKLLSCWHIQILECADSLEWVRWPHQEKVNEMYRTKIAEFLDLLTKCLEMFSETDERMDEYEKFYEQFVTCWKIWNSWGLHQQNEGCWTVEVHHLKVWWWTGLLEGVHRPREGRAERHVSRHWWLHRSRVLFPVLWKFTQGNEGDVRRLGWEQGSKSLVVSSTDSEGHSWGEPAHYTRMDFRSRWWAQRSYCQYTVSGTVRWSCEELFPRSQCGSFVRQVSSSVPASAVCAAAAPVVELSRAWWATTHQLLASTRLL